MDLKVVASDREEDCFVETSVDRLLIETVVSVEQKMQHFLCTISLGRLLFIEYYIVKA